MLVGLTAIFAISFYHRKRCDFESHLGDTTLCYIVCQCLSTGRWFSSNEAGRRDIIEILLTVALNTIN